MIEVDHRVLDTVAAMRRMGLQCCLATNQEAIRAEHMSRTLGYEKLFDREFYSCRIGRTKPADEYFSRILKATGLQANKVLFLDDHQVNVDAARGVGLHASRFVLDGGTPELNQLLAEFGIQISRGAVVPPHLP